MSSIIIPWDCVMYIVSHMPLDVAVQLVSKEWVRSALCRVLSAKMTWANRLRVFTHGALVGQEDMFWQMFGQDVLKLMRRKRNSEYVLTWRARVRYCMVVRDRCRACGSKTKALVLGRVLLCQRCRADWRLKHSFMAKVHQVRPFVSNADLRRVPYHGGNAPFCPHWRFWSDIVEVAPYLKNERRVRRRVAKG
jgi:hypothetical protein